MTFHTPLDQMLLTINALTTIIILLLLLPLAYYGLPREHFVKARLFSKYDLAKKALYLILTAVLLLQLSDLLNVGLLAVRGKELNQIFSATLKIAAQILIIGGLFLLTKIMKPIIRGKK